MTCRILTLSCLIENRLLKQVLTVIYYALKIVSDSETEYGLVKITDKLIFDFKVQTPVVIQGKICACAQIDAEFGLVPTETASQTFVPFGIGKSDKGINLNALARREKIMDVQIEVKHVHGIMFEEIIKGRFQSDGVGDVVLVLDSESHAFDFCPIIQMDTEGTFPCLRECAGRADDHHTCDNDKLFHNQLLF